MATSKDPDMLDEYNFSNGVRGKYAARYQEGTNIVRLDDDVAAMFPNSQEVNETLRTLGKLIQHHADIILTKSQPDKKPFSSLSRYETKLVSIFFLKVVGGFWSAYFRRYVREVLRTIS